MIKCVFPVLFSLMALQAVGQTKTITYKESQEDILNPERGFYIPTSTRASNFELLEVAQLRAYRGSRKPMGKATYAVSVSLIYRGYELDTFKNQALSVSFLNNFQEDLNTIRAAGLKVILRFAYTNSTKAGDCTDEYKICPPYGDAPRHIVLKHIQQLTPFLQKNADVIAVLQEGFIGIWGENYFTDYFGDASTNAAGKILDTSWLHRNEVMKALLDALPPNRMVQARTPQIKQKFVYGPAAKLTSLPLTSREAFTKSDKARIGFHNDCFLSSEDDYGTFYDYGSSTQPRQPANKILRRYIEADTKYTVVGGETCDDAFSPQNDCAPAGYAEKEMKAMHYSYLNAAYNVDVNNDWDSSGCLYQIRRQLGYRFILRKATLPLVLKKTEPLTIALTLENTGYAGLYNPRPVEIILQNKATKSIYPLRVPTNSQRWLTGIHQVKHSLQLPIDLPAGSYQVFLFMPDESRRLRKQAAYSVQFANLNTWDKNTGYNSLQHTLLVK